MQKAILFIPDISGFTEFVKQTEVQHSKHIIKELLELLIDQNQVGLELAEIEGDALFFYKTDQDLDSATLAQQIKSMHRAFHQHLQLYKYRRVCNCGACTNAEGLLLKFIVHEADIDFIEVKSSRKPFGEEVIKAHRLLKNNVPVEEYVLASSAYDDTTSRLANQFESSSERVEEVFDDALHAYHYAALDRTETKIKVDQDIPEPILGRHLLSKQIEINIHPNDLFQFVLDFEHRHLWSEGVDEITYEEGEINQLGSKHTCIIDGNSLELSTIYRGEAPGELIFIESTEDAPFIKNLASIFKISPTTNGSLLEVNTFTKSTSLIGKLLTPILRLKLNKGQSNSLDKLKEILEKNRNADR